MLGKVTTNPTIGNFKISILQLQKDFFQEVPFFKTCARLKENNAR